MDYDRERYAQIHRALTGDPKHLLDTPFVEVSRELSLDNVPWDDVTLQERGVAESRMYHFRGFYLYVYLNPLPMGITPNSDRTWTSEEHERPKVLWLDGQRSCVRIDGIRDRQERMEWWRKEVEESARRINEAARKRWNGG
jgi:hypothetical protein